MAEPLKDSSRLAEETARRLAKGQAEVFRKYADLFSDYGSRGLETKAFGEGLLKLAVDQSARLAGDAFEIGSSYWRWLTNVGEARSGGSPAQEGTPRKGRKSGTATASR